MATTGAGFRVRRRTVTEERVRGCLDRQEEGEEDGENEEVQVVRKVCRSTTLSIVFFQL